MSRPVPDVDVVIPVHRLERPVERAVASVADPAHGVRAVVVCHNMDPRDLQERLAPFGEGVRILDLHDGVPSPAGPLNVGLDAARASWVTCMGSDDHEQPGAAAAWIDHLRRRPVDALVLPVLRAESDTVDVPPIRPGRLQDLDPVRDRLCHRTGPLVLARTEVLRTHGIRMSEGLRTGEDLAFTSHLWMVARHIDLLAPGSPCYVEDRSGPRVSATPFPLAELLEPARRLAGEAWVTRLGGEHLHALAVRVVRESVLRALAGRADRLDEDGARCAREVARLWSDLDPGIDVPLSFAEEDAWRRLLAGADVGALAQAGRDLVSLPRWRRVLPHTPRGLGDPEARPRHLLSRLLRPAPWRG